MDKDVRVAGLPEERPSFDAAFVTESVRKDFSGLIAVFDRQLESAPQVNGEVRSTIADARAAAERGLRLSEQLIEILRNPDPEN